MPSRWSGCSQEFEKEFANPIKQGTTGRGVAWTWHSGVGLTSAHLAAPALDPLHLSSATAVCTPPICTPLPYMLLAPSFYLFPGQERNATAAERRKSTQLLGVLDDLVSPYVHRAGPEILEVRRCGTDRGAQGEAGFLGGRARPAGYTTSSGPNGTVPCKPVGVPVSTGQVWGKHAERVSNVPGFWFRLLACYTGVLDDLVLQCVHRMGPGEWRWAG